MNGSSPGTVSSVRPVRAFGATARTALSGIRGRSKLALRLKLGAMGDVTSSEGRPPFGYWITLGAFLVDVEAFGV